MVTWPVLFLLLLAAALGTRHSHESDCGLAPHHPCAACAWRAHATGIVAPPAVTIAAPVLSLAPVPIPAAPVLPRRFCIATASRAPPVFHG